MINLVEDLLPIIEAAAPFLAKGLMAGCPTFSKAMTSLMDVFGFKEDDKDIVQKFNEMPDAEQKLVEAENEYKSHLSTADINIKLQWEKDKEDEE